MKLIPLLLCSGYALLAAGCAATDGPDSVAHAKDVNESIPLKVSDSASVFLVEMVDARLMDHEEGKLAVERSTRPVIREYGAWMVRDQSEMLKQLNTLANSSRVTVPLVVGADKREALETLQKLEGEAFDKAFIKAMRTAHERDVAKLSKATTLPDAAVAAYANTTLPLVELHLDGIRQIDKAY